MTPYLSLPTFVPSVISLSIFLFAFCTASLVCLAWLICLSRTACLECRVCLFCLSVLSVHLFGFVYLVSQSDLSYLSVLHAYLECRLRLFCMSFLSVLLFASVLYVMSVVPPFCVLREFCRFCLSCLHFLSV